MTLTAINPTDGTELARYDELTPEQIETALGRASAAFLEWRARPISERAELLRSLAAALRADKAELARQASLEMGKPIREAEAEVEKSAAFTEYYAEHAEAFLAPRAIDAGGVENYVRFEPLASCWR